MLNIVFELIVQVTWLFQFTSGEGSMAVVSVVGRLVLAPRPVMSYLSHSTKPSARTLGVMAHVSLWSVRGSFSVTNWPLKPDGRFSLWKYWNPEKKNSLSLMIGPPICPVVS